MGHKVECHPPKPNSTSLTQLCPLLTHTLRWLRDACNLPAVDQCRHCICCLQDCPSRCSDACLRCLVCLQQCSIDSRHGGMAGNLFFPPFDFMEGKRGLCDAPNLAKTGNFDWGNVRHKQPSEAAVRLIKLVW